MISAQHWKAVGPPAAVAAVLGLVLGTVLTLASRPSPASAPPVPLPAPTVTVTAQPEPVPTPSPTPYLPESCAETFRAIERLYPFIDKYEREVGATVGIQDDTMQGIITASPKILNVARQELIDLRNQTVGSLGEITSTTDDIAAGIAACRTETAP